MTGKQDSSWHHDNTNPTQSELCLLEIREVPEMLEIVKNAYPSMKLHMPSEWVEMERELVKAQGSLDGEKYYGVRRNGNLVGTMGLHDFRMNLRGAIVDAGGVGLVAVDLMHKKQGIAKELIEGFLRHYRSRSFPITLLYAFRTDFYHQMGYGFGPKMHMYRIPPTRFPKGPSKEQVRMLGPNDVNMLYEYEEQRFQEMHGYITSSLQSLDERMKRKGLRMAGYVEDGKIEGYIAFGFKQVHAENGLQNDLVVRDFTYRAPHVREELFTFLHSQFDQIQNVVLYTQDPDFYHLIPDARNSSGNLIPPIYHETNTSGVGLMYRVIDTEGLFRALAEHSFAGETCRVKFDIRDSFLTDHVGALVDFRNGFPMVEQDDGDYDVELTMDVATFSSMVMGVVSLSKLVKYGLAKISDDDYLGRLDAMFRTEDVPYCLTAF